MMKFSKSFTAQAPLPRASLEAARAVLLSGSLHRYQTADDGLNPVAAFETEFARWQGTKYCLAVTSGGQAMQLALRAAGVTHGAPVLTNAFTLAPVPGAIHAVGGEAVLVEINKNLVLDFDDLKAKAQSSGAKVLLLSNMRGHLADMEHLISITESMGITVIEDCAHTMGATWNGRKSGNFGTFGCFSTQAYKHLNSGEGGLLVSNHPQAIAKATVLSGSYMNYDRHVCVPEEKYFIDTRVDCANTSARMDALRAAILRPQLTNLDQSIKQWNHLYSIAEKKLSKCNALRLPDSAKQSIRVGSSLQFLVSAFDYNQCSSLVTLCAEKGVDLKWFGRDTPMGFTSTHKDWKYVKPHSLPVTDEVLSTLFDFRIPLSFNDDDCQLLSNIIVECVIEIAKDAS